MNQMKKFIVILIIILAIIVGCILVLKNNIQDEINTETHNDIKSEEVSKISKVNNASMFFTVESCVNKYIRYLASKDGEIIYNLIDEGYKKQFSVSNENIWEHVEKIDKNYIFSAKDMYYEIDANVEKYYVTGSIEEDTFSDDMISTDVKDFNITVILNMDNNTFSIIPYGYGGIYYEEENA